MIKEKDTYCYENHQSILNGCTVYDENGAISLDYVKQQLEPYYIENNISAVMTEDTISFKTGMFKSATAPCLIVSHSQTPDEFRKLVIIAANADGKTTLRGCWYGESKTVKLIKKANKIIKKAEKDDRKTKNYDLDVTSTLGLTAKGVIQNFRLKRIIKKIDACKPTEQFFHNSLLNSFAYITQEALKTV